MANKYRREVFTVKITEVYDSYAKRVGELTSFTTTVHRALPTSSA